MLQRFYLEGVYFEVIESLDDILIKTFIVPKKLRNNGLGSKILKIYTKNILKTIKVEISDIFNSDLERLKKFYTKCGILNENLIF